MFASLKNKIREETGNDLSKLTAKISSSTAQRIDAFRGRSQQGSTSSVNSIVSSDKEDGLDKQDDDYKKRLVKLEIEYTEKSKEWQEIINEKDKRLQTLENEKEEALKQINSLKEYLKYSEGIQKKLLEHREDKDQMDSFQSQELTKIKQLVLLREKELAEKTTSLKETAQQLDKMKSEILRLRKQEERLSDVQQDGGVEIKAVQKNLDNTECQLEKSEEECSRLRLSTDSEHQANQSLRQMITKLEKELTDEKVNSLNVQKTLTRVTSEKNSALLRNAELSQQIELSKQETRRQEIEVVELINKMALLEDENKKYKDKESKNAEQELKNSISYLEEQLSEKNKAIKTLQLRLADLKKTLQQELRTPGSMNYFNDTVNSNSSAAVLMPSFNTTKNVLHNNTINRLEEDVNFKYLKHVIIKFLTSREYEAQHLIRAVSTLLKFSPEEEKLLHDTIEWKMSWFAPKPKVGNGQLARSIPPS